MGPTEEALKLADWLIEHGMVSDTVTRIDLAYSIDAWAEAQ